MTTERFRQIEELYHAAREAAVGERAALLAQADPELRREVESLLARLPTQFTSLDGEPVAFQPSLKNRVGLPERIEVEGPGISVTVQVGYPTIQLQLQLICYF